MKNELMRLVENERFMEISRPVTNDLAVILTEAYVSAGQNLPEFEFGAIVKTLEVDIKAKFATLTMAEISHAIEMGVRGEYTERTDICNANIYQWLKKWKHSDERASILQEMFKNRKALPERGSLTEGEKWQSSFDHAMRTYGQYKTHGQIIDFGNAAYTFLDGLGLIEFTNEQKREIYNQAQDRIISQHDDGNFDSLEGIRAAKRLVEEILSGGRHEMVVNEAKRMALVYYFETIDSQNINFEELLKSKKTC